MKNVVFEALAEAARKGEPVALGIISGVKGSSPQKVGAKALFYPDGRIQGTLGGGCLEAEIQHRAIASLQSGRPETFDLLLDHDFGWDDGLICGGKVFGLILPNAQKAGENFWRELGARRKPLSWGVGRDFAIELLPGKPASASRVLWNNEPLSKPDSLRTVNNPATAPPSPGGEGRGEGEPDLLPTDRFYEETVTPPCALWIAGAGHIAQAVAPLAVHLDFDVTVFDDRPALANHNYFPKSVAVKAEVWEKLLPLPLPETPSFALIVTRGHRHDALVLKEWIRKPFLFLGMIGSRRKARTIFEHFQSEKIATPEELKRISCPVGVSIRARSVQEIAVSIMAQFIEKRAELVEEKRVSGAAGVELVR